MRCVPESELVGTFGMALVIVGGMILIAYEALKKAGRK